MEAIVLKAYNGDRVKNLNGLADALKEVVAEAQQHPILEDGTVMLSAILQRRLLGYAEQLGIIADDLTGKAKGKKKA